MKANLFGRAVGYGAIVLAAMTGGVSDAAAADLPWTGNWNAPLGGVLGDAVRAFGASTTGDGQVADTAANIANAYVRSTANAGSFLSDSASTGLSFNRTFKPAANKYYEVTMTANLSGSQTVADAGGSHTTSVTASASMGLASGLPASYIRYGGGGLLPKLPPGTSRAVATGNITKNAWVYGGGDYKVFGALSTFSSTTNGNLFGIEAESNIFTGQGFAVNSSIVEKEIPFTEFDVTVNVYKNAGVTKAEAVDYLNKVNEILRPARIHLNVRANKIALDATAGDNGATDKPMTDPGTAGDGDFTGKELRQVATAGAKEVQGGKGLKVVFARSPLATSTTPGVSYHRVPVAVGKERATAQQTAETLAHEILHTLTLAEKYNLDFTNQSDNSGHAPDTNDDGGKSGKGNVMAPSNYRAGTAIQPLQIVKILNDGQMKTWGKQIDKPTPDAVGLKAQLQKGGGQDDEGDVVAAGYLDLSEVTLTSLAADAAMQGQVGLAGLFPEAATFSAGFGLDFDSTPLHAGADRRVHIDVGRTSPGGPILTTARMFDLTSPGSNPLDLPDVEVVGSRLASDSLDDFGDAANQILFSFDKSLLGVLSPSTPAPLRAFTLGETGVVDELLSDLHLNWWNEQPTLDLGVPQATPSDFVPIMLSGLTPSTPFDLVFENDALFSATTDAQGGYAGGFTMPSFSLDKFAFVTAVDDLGLSAFNVIGVVPEPATGLLMMMAAAAIWAGAAG